jgi:DNA-directed RNA polymerase subunit RPC12/RpoP
MDQELYKKFRNFSSWIVILSVINLFILSLIPWISIVENGSDNAIFYNSIMMERSGNNQVKDIANNLFFIINLLWIVIIINSISYLGFSVYLSENYPRFSKIMINTGYITLIVNILIIYLQINLLFKVIQMDSIYLASIFSIIKFAYIPLIIGFLILIISIINTLSVVNIAGKKNNLKNGKKQTYEKILMDKSKKVVEKEPSANKIISDFEKDILQSNKGNLLVSEEEQKNEIDAKSEKESLEPRNFIKNEKNLENKSEGKNNLEPFSNEKHKEISRGAGETLLSQQFEKALSTAIDKKQLEMKNQAPLKTMIEHKDEKFKRITPKKEIQTENIENLFNDEKKDLRKKINIRCPQCKSVFQFEVNQNTKNVKCPNCSKEGAIKNLEEIFKYQQQS